MDPILRAMVDVSVLICVAKVLASLFERFKQPQVLGELGAGLIFAPTMLGGLTLFGEPIVELNSFVIAFAQIGAILLLFFAGLEVSFKQFRKVGPQSFMIGTTGVVVPFLLATYVFLFLNYDWASVLLISAALTATSIGITIRTLKDMNELGSPEGQMTLNAAVIDDVLALLLLTVVVSVISVGVPPTGTDLLVLVAKSLGFWVALLLGAVYLTPKVIGLFERLNVTGSVEAAATGLCFGTAALAAALGLSPILGGFCAGMAIAGTRYREKIRDYFGKVMVIFTPIFFSVMGAALDPSLIPIWAIGGIGVLLVIAVAGKLIGCGLPAAAHFKNDRSGLRVGIGMISRGEVGLLIAGVGLTSSIIAQDIYAQLLGAIIVTTLFTPALLKWAYRRTPMELQASTGYSLRSFVRASPPDPS